MPKVILWFEWVLVNISIPLVVLAFAVPARIPAMLVYNMLRSDCADALYQNRLLALSIQGEIKWVILVVLALFFIFNLLRLTQKRDRRSVWISIGLTIFSFFIATGFTI